MRERVSRALEGIDYVSRRVKKKKEKEEEEAIKRRTTDLTTVPRPASSRAAPSPANLITLFSFLLVLLSHYEMFH